MSNDEKVFKAEHVRVLREALARIGNGSGSPQKTALAALSQYSILIRESCMHPDDALVRGAKVCLSCGQIVGEG